MAHKNARMVQVQIDNLPGSQLENFEGDVIRIAVRWTKKNQSTEKRH